MDSVIPLGQKNTLAEYMILFGADNRPPMLEKDLYDSWKSQMELYMQNKEHGRMILESVENGPLVWPTIEENGVTRTKNIVAKDLWERVQLLMQGTSLTKQERECKLYDAFDKFTHIKGETLHKYYLRFTQLINDMNIYNMKIKQFQVRMSRKASHPEVELTMCPNGSFTRGAAWTPLCGVESLWRVKGEHDGCAEKLQVLEDQNSKLSRVSKDQALRIKELEDVLAKKDSTLVYAERINVERAQEKEKLVAQLSQTEMEKFDCIRKLLPTVVSRLFQSHEYKHSLSKPFNLAIHARMENFDAYADKKMYVEYDKLFEKRYPYVEKISSGFRHIVADLLKVYPEPPPSGQALSTTVGAAAKPSSRKTPGSSAPPKP
ncbi:hypothetical protein Tco_0661925 [Tanacetum coccineum]